MHGAISHIDLAVAKLVHLVFSFWGDCAQIRFPTIVAFIKKTQCIPLPIRSSLVKVLNQNRIPIPVIQIDLRHNIQTQQHDAAKVDKLFHGCRF